MKLHYATSNVGKIRSLQRYFSNTNVEISASGIELPEPRSDDLQEIAHSKVVYAYERVRSPVVALDAGFFIPSLNGFPKAFVNFALDTIGLEGILKLAEGKDRSCEFRDCLAYLDGECDSPMYFISITKGNLSSGIRGAKKEYHWSVLSSIFMPKGSDKTLAEMTEDEFKMWNASKPKSSSKSFAEWYLGWNKGAKRL